MAEMQMFADKNMTMPMINGAATGAGHFRATTLYVDGLDTNVTDFQVFEMFKTVSEVVSVRVCRDVRTLRSLGHAYVNFSNAGDAARALDRLNCAPLGKKSIRIYYRRVVEEVNDEEWYVRRAQKEAEREMERQFANMRPMGMGPGLPNQHAPMHQNQQGMPGMHNHRTADNDDIGIGSLPMRDAPVPQPVPFGTQLVSALVNALPDQQRTMLEEHLYPLVDQLEHEHAAKVTGMLLQLDTAEVLHLMESPQALNAKVSEAMEILRNATQQQQSHT